MILARELRRLERDDLVCDVHDDLVVDLAVHVLDTAQDRLNAAHVLFQEHLFRTVALMDLQRLVKYFDDIPARNRSLIGENLPPAGHEWR